jgi:Trk K+ transport system NAD-binding subunit
MNKLEKIKLLGTKIKILIKQNIKPLLIVLLWFIFNYFFFLYETSLNYSESLLILFYFKESPTLWGSFYSSMTEFLIFGLVFSLITIELFRKYNPIEACRRFASVLHDHVIVIGYNHLGQRVANYYRELGKDIIVVDKNPDVVQDLIDMEEPVIVDDGLSLQALLDAGVEEAKAVFITSDHLELLMVASSNVRHHNRDCRLVCRVFQDDIAEVIANTFNAETISTSRYAANIILEEIKKGRYKDILLIGMNHINIRLLKEIRSEFSEINYSLIEENEELVEELLEEKDTRVIIGDPKEYITLRKIPIKDMDLVINTLHNTADSILINKRIRDLNKNCKVISRFFLDEVAQVMTEEPFNAQVISSSKFTLERMKRKGLLDL